MKCYNQGPWLQILMFGHNTWFDDCGIIVIILLSSYLKLGNMQLF